MASAMLDMFLDFQKTAQAESFRTWQRWMNAAKVPQIAQDVQVATTPHEVDSLLDGLPALATGAPVPAVSEPNAPAPKLRERLVAIMSGIMRRGLWRIPRRLRVVAIMGGVDSK